MRHLKYIILFLFITANTLTFSQITSPPKVLIVTAHPDDETGCAATVYAITHHLKGKVDLALFTNGEGGYKYSTLAEDIYGLELTEEKIGREYLPSIRKRELLSAGKIIGIRDYYFFDQKDNRYTLDEREVLDSIWDINLIKHRLKDIISKNQYDFIFCLIPVPETHGHHKAATILALNVIKELSENMKPVILAMSVSKKADSLKYSFSELKGYPETKLAEGIKPFVFDRTRKFSFKKVLDYKVIVNWEIAEHKSQGTMQLAMNEGDFENFLYFDINGKNGIDKTRNLFESLAKDFYKQKQY